MRLCWDIEATNLLNSDSIDYTTSPYKLKDDFEIHSVVLIDVDTDKEYEFVQDDVYKYAKEFILDSATELIAHNSISYDHTALKAALGMNFEIGVFGGVKHDKFYDTLMDSVCGKPITITDTLVMSKTLNPDRVAHSIDYFGKLHGEHKIDWRAKAIEIGLIEHNAPKGAEFRVYHPEMLIYNKQDVRSNIKTWKFLLKEWGDWNWKDAYELEKAVAEVITRQEHRGFSFNKQLAEENVRELDILMEGIREIVEPVLPPKPMTKGKLKDYEPPKKQFKQNGELAAITLKFVEKHGGKIEQDEGGYYTDLYGQTLALPLTAPLLTHEPATVKDTTYIKGWLVKDMQWSPSMYKERDLTVDSKKKKLSREKFIETVDRYVEQTLSSPFCRDRCDELEVSPQRLREKLLKHDHEKRPLKVYTNPTLTVGMEKDIDPNLLLIADKFPHAKLVSEYLTYSHRRNSILGGGVDPDDDEEEAEKGFLSAARIDIDGRIQTPADTCGAGTSRFKHRLVANIPRVTSLYGKKMRAMFGVSEGFLQMGYDFDSLEAKIESHYVYKYAGGPEYGVSLTAEKPFDCHSMLAASISELLGRPFPRGTAKNVKYGCSYNAQVKRVAKTVGCTLAEAQIIFDAFWTQAYPLLVLKENMQKYWETTGGKKFLIGIDGRKLPIRSKGNVINTAFQSAGVISAKRAMVLHDRMLKAEGLSVDFFLDDWRSMDFCQQLIAYHDEAQNEVRRSAVKFKKFDSEDEAKVFKDPDGKVWSDVIHNDKGFFRAYNRAGELATIAVKQAGEYYRLNVELTAGYIIGTDWASCH